MLTVDILGVGYRIAGIVLICLIAVGVLSACDNGTQPSAIPVHEPRTTVTAEPTVTATLWPAATSTAESSPTSRVEPTATHTPESTQTATHSLEPTPTPKPTETFTPEPTATPTLPATATPTATYSPTPTATPINTAINTATSLPTPTKTPKPTPVPTAKLALDANATVVGYWSDGTADVEITTSLHNEGGLRLTSAVRLAVTCSHDGKSIEDCRHETSVSLPDGYGPVTKTLTARSPTGRVSFEIDYGEGVQTLSVDVPSRIVGVERGVWECFSDRVNAAASQFRFNMDFPCSGLYFEHVAKWESPVRLWFNPAGDPEYQRVLKEILAELSPILSLEFQHVANEEDAQLKAHLGLDVSVWGHKVGACADGGGCGNAEQDESGVIRSGYIVVWNSDPPGIRGVTLHEALHALLDMGHRQRDPTSIMSYHGVVDGRVMHRMDEALLRLNSHPLVEPGMTMMAVRDLIVFSDELLDGPIHTPLSPLRMLEEAYLKLLHADSSSYKISISESRCGGGIGWAEYETANYWFEGARWTRIEDGSGSHHIIRHHSGSPGEVWSDRSGEWREVEWERSALSGFLSQRGEISLHSIIRAIVSRYDAVEVDSLRRVDGKVTITIRPVSRDAIAPYHGSIVFLLDDQSYEVLEYSFSLTTESCGKIDVRAYDGRFEIEFPLPEAIAERSRDLKSCEMEDLGYISDVIRREGVFPGSCGLDPDRNVRRYYFSLDGPDKLVGIRVHSGYGPIALRLLDADEVLETSLVSYFSPNGPKIDSVLPMGEYAIEIEAFDVLVAIGFDLQIEAKEVSRAVSVSAGAQTSCALYANGIASCWGDVDLLNMVPPIQERFDSIGTGGGQGCGLRQDGTAVCWGVVIAGPPEDDSFTAIDTAPFSICALRPDGTPICWGDDSFVINSPPSHETFNAISMGEGHACGLRADGTPVCWGDDTVGQASPPEGVKLTSISSGSWHTCGLKASGSPVCWGTFKYCALNQDGTVRCWVPEGPLPEKPPVDEKLIAISAGGSHTCGLRADGAPVCWGRNEQGQTTPPTETTFTDITCGAYHTCGVTAEGTVVCWGRNEYGESSPP